MQWTFVKQMKIQRACRRARIWFWQRRPLAATCSGGHLRPLALAATCGHSIGCKWLQVVADKKRMRAATGGHSSGGKWLPMKNQMLVATCGHSIGCKWLQVAAAEKRLLADTGGHWRPLDWPLQVAASGCKWLPMRRKCWWPLAATRLAASGCKWLPMRREWWRPLAATGDHSSGCKWLQVAARRGWNYIFHHSSSLGRRILGIFRCLRTENL